MPSIRPALDVTRALVQVAVVLALLPAASLDAQERQLSGIFEVERPMSFVVQMNDRMNHASFGRMKDHMGHTAPSTDLSQYLARYYLVTNTLTGTVAGTLSGALMVFLVCTAEDERDQSQEFLDTGGCLNRDRWFGYVAGGAFLGTVLGGARGASERGGRFGRLSTLSASDCTFRDGLRRGFIGTALGSVPAIAYFVTGGDALGASLLAPIGQGAGALIALWGCIGEPRLGPTGGLPIR